MIDISIIKIPYTTHPYMQKYEGELFSKQPDTKIIEQKLIELKKFDCQLYAFSHTTKHIESVSKFLLNLDNKSIVNLALNLEEDIAIFHEGILDSICFCFPSSWVPSEKIGMTLQQIHMPVADGEKLVSASNKISETIANNGPFRRFVWTLTNTSELNQHPKNKSIYVPTCIEEIYFRMETQTTIPLGDGLTSMFLVKVDTFPLTKLWAYKEIRHAIIASVNSMSQSVLEYKNLNEIKKVLSGYGV